MSRQNRSFNSQNRRDLTSNRLNSKVDSVLRLSNALLRDVNRSNAQNVQQRPTQQMDLNSKLDLISENLIEVRDKLESYNRQMSSGVVATAQPSVQSPIQQLPTSMLYSLPITSGNFRYLY